MSAALRKMSRRVTAFAFDQAANASWAPSAACRASNLDAEEHFHKILPVPGFTTLNVVPVMISCPLICRGTVYPAFWPVSAISWEAGASNQQVKVLALGPRVTNALVKKNSLIYVDIYVGT